MHRESPTRSLVVSEWAQNPAADLLVSIFCSRKTESSGTSLGRPDPRRPEVL